MIMASERQRAKDECVVKKHEKVQEAMSHKEHKKHKEDGEKAHAEAQRHRGKRTVEECNEGKFF
jgi:hypothetical protein